MSEVSTTIRWQSPWPLWVWALVALAAAVWTILSYRREARVFPPRRCAVLAALRCVALALVTFMLAQPTLQQQRVAKPRIAILIDRSASMTTQDVLAATLPEADVVGDAATPLRLSRSAAAARIVSGGARALLPQLEQQFATDLSGFADSLTPLSIDELRRPAVVDAAVGTRAGDAVAAALAADSALPAAVVLLTDGITTGGRSLSDAAVRARALGVPIYAIALGSDRPQPDVAVENVLVEPIVFPGDRLQVEAQIRASGYAGKSATAALQVAGETIAETPVVLLPDGAAATVRIAWRPIAPGPVDAAIVIEPLVGETDHDNNRAAFHVEVRREPIRVLLAAAVPSFEFRALKSLLQRDPAVRLSAFLQEADPEFAEVDRAAVRDFPQDAAAFADYDVLLVGDLDPALLPSGAWDQVLSFVAEQGGGLAVIAGPLYMPAAYRESQSLLTLMPIAGTADNPLRGAFPATEPAKVVPTPVGLEQPTLQLGEHPAATEAVWEALPPVYWVYAAAKPKPGAQTLALATPLTSNEDQRAHSATADGAMPIVLRQYVGAGEVLMHLTDETWRWRWRNDDRYFARYWGQAVRRLARGRVGRGRAKLSTDRAVYAVGEPVRIRGAMRGSLQSPGGAGPVVSIEGAATPVRRIVLPARLGAARVYEATVHDLPPDRYQVAFTDESVSAAPARFLVEAPPGELTRLAVDWQALVDAAEATAGRAYRASDARQLLADLPPPAPVVLERLPADPLWNRSWGVALLCATLAVEWFIRRRSGML